MWFAARSLLDNAPPQSPPDFSESLCPESKGHLVHRPPGPVGDQGFVR